MNTMLMLVRREFWEHRSLYIAPLVMAGLIVLSSIWGVVNISGDHDMYIGDATSVDQLTHMDAQERERLQAAIDLPDDRKAMPYAASILLFAAVLSALVCIVVFFYLIDCLYAERRDRSILFWKSLPVSDSQVVWSKLAVALIVVPVGVLALSAVTQLLVGLVYWFRFHDSLIGDFMVPFDAAAWLRAQWVALLVAIGGVLWYAPIAGYLLLMSAWARRVVFLWAVLPPLGLAVFETMTFHSTHVWEFLGRRFAGFIAEMDLDTSVFKHQPGDAQMPSIDEAFNALSLSGMFTHPEMWVGLACGGALVFATIRFRRYRDES